MSRNRRSLTAIDARLALEQFTCSARLSLAIVRDIHQQGAAQLEADRQSPIIPMQNWQQLLNK
jgi:hypothetical protein